MLQSIISSLFKTNNNMSLVQNPSFDSKFSEILAYQGHIASVFTISLSLLLILLLIIYKQSTSKKHLAKNQNIRKITTATIPQAKHLFPIRIPFVDGLYTLFRLRIDGVRVLEEWIPKFGGLFEMPLGMTLVTAVSDPTITQKILSSSSPQHLNKPHHIYDNFFVDCLKDGLINSEYEVWSRHRKMVNRAFTYKSLQSYLKAMNSHSRHLVNVLKSECVPRSDGNMFVQGQDVLDLIYLHVVKIISEVVMGLGNTVTDEESACFHQDFSRFKGILLVRFLNPQQLIPLYWYFHPNRKEYAILSGKIDMFIGKITQKYRQEYEEMGQPEILNIREDVMEDNDVGEKPFRCVIQEMLCCGATDKEIYDEFGTLIVAGHETTAMALQMLLVNLALNPHHQDLCRQEIDTLLAAKQGNINDVDDLTMDDLSNLKYLERCIQESQRLTSTVPMFIRRLDAPLKIDDDLELRAGSNVVVLTWMIHKNPQLYPNPEQFDPDRFLQEEVINRHPFAFLPFSGGPRNCIGWKLALMKMKVIMTYILSNFEVFTTDKLEDVKLLFGVTLLPERNYNIVLQRRK